MGPRLHQIDELTKAGLTSRQKAELLHLPLKTIQEYESRIRKIDGETMPSRRYDRRVKDQDPLAAERDRMRAVLRAVEHHELPVARIPSDAWTYYARIHKLEEQMSQQKEYAVPSSRELAGVIIREHMAERHAELAHETGDVVAFSAVEVNAAMNYWRGRAEEYNATRDSIMRHHPELAKDLPPALEVDESRVRQVSLEQEREQHNSLAMSR